METKVLRQVLLYLSNEIRPARGGPVADIHDKGHVGGRISKAVSKFHLGTVQHYDKRNISQLRVRISAWASVNTSDNYKEVR